MCESEQRRFPNHTLFHTPLLLTWGRLQLKLSSLFFSSKESYLPRGEVCLTEVPGALEPRRERIYTLHKTPPRNRFSPCPAIGLNPCQRQQTQHRISAQRRSYVRKDFVLRSGLTMKCQVVIYYKTRTSWKITNIHLGLMSVQNIQLCNDKYFYCCYGHHQASTTWVDMDSDPLFLLFFQILDFYIWLRSYNEKH